MRNKPFPLWLRSKQLPILLSFMLVAFAAMQSLHEQIDHGHPYGANSQCEYCLLSQTADGGIIPLAISLPSSLADYAPEVFIPLFLPLARDYTQPARAPPSSLSV